MFEMFFSCAYGSKTTPPVNIKIKENYYEELHNIRYSICAQVLWL